MENFDYSMIFMAVVLVVVGLCGLFAFFKGFRKTVAKTVAVVISAIISFGITKAICNSDSTLLTDAVNMVKDMLGMEIVDELTSATSIADVATLLISMIIAPFIFMLSFLLINLVLSIVLGLLSKLIPFFKGFVFKIAAVPLGLLNGFVVVGIVLMPILGTIGVVDVAVDNIIANDEDLVEEYEVLGIDEFMNSAFVNFMLNAGVTTLYDDLTTNTYDGEEVILESEVDNSTKLVSNVLTLAGDVAEYDQTQIDAFNSINDSMNSSALLKEVSCTVLSETSTAWLEKGEYLGFAKIDAGEMVNPIIDELLEVLATTTTDTINKDFDTISQIFELLITEKLFSMIDDLPALLDVMNEKGLLTEVTNIIDGNERMVGINDEFSELSLRTLSTMLLDDSIDSAEYDDMVDEMADFLNSTNDEDLSVEQRVDEIMEDSDELMDEYGVDIPEVVLNDMAEDLVDELGDKDEVTNEDIEYFLEKYT